MKELSRYFTTLLRYLFAFQPLKDHSDEIWHFHVPSPKNKSKWLVQSFTKYQDTIYWTINFEAQMEFDLKKRRLQAGRPAFSSTEEHDVLGVIRSCVETLKKANKDWLKYHRELLRGLPKKYRFGLIQRRILWKIWPEIYRPDLKLTQKEREWLTTIFREQEGLMEKIALTSTPSLNTYLNYCRVAYLSNSKEYQSSIKENMTGLEMYKSMADGRHEGLVNIDPNSLGALEKWYHSSRGGGHPWEICRGGNTTHIDLGLYKENDKWFIFLQGNSTGRMLETARMALAFYKRKMPFRWFHSNDVRLKIEGRDNIGIIPEYHSIHRAYQLFELNDHVFDCIHLNDLDQHKKKAAGFITWQPLDPLYPKQIQRDHKEALLKRRN